MCAIKIRIWTQKCIQNAKIVNEMHSKIASNGNSIQINLFQLNKKKLNYFSQRIQRIKPNGINLPISMEWEIWRQFNMAVRFQSFNGAHVSLLNLLLMCGTRLEWLRCVQANKETAAILKKLKFSMECVAPIRGPPINRNGEKSMAQSIPIDFDRSEIRKSNAKPLRL